MRKIIQICSDTEGLYALTDDGKVWLHNLTAGWVEVPFCDQFHEE